MSQDTIQILFAGELPTWLKVTQAVGGAPGGAMQLHRATSLRDAMRCLAADKWDAVLLDLYHPPAKELLSALKLHSVFHDVPAIGLFSLCDPHLEGAALSSGAATCIPIDTFSAEALQEATFVALHGKKFNGTFREATQMELLPIGPGRAVNLSGRIEAISHALSNLLCVISANADILADQVAGSQPAFRSVDQIKKATKTAAELMRQLKTP